MATFGEEPIALASVYASAANLARPQRHIFSIRKGYEDYFVLETVDSFFDSG